MTIEDAVIKAAQSAYGSDADIDNVASVVFESNEKVAWVRGWVRVEEAEWEPYMEEALDEPVAP